MGFDFAHQPIALWLYIALYVKLCVGLWTNWGWISGIWRRAFSLEMMSDEKGEEKHFKETWFWKNTLKNRNEIPKKNIMPLQSNPFLACRRLSESNTHGFMIGLHCDSKPCLATMAMSWTYCDNLTPELPTQFITSCTHFAEMRCWFFFVGGGAPWHCIGLPPFIIFSRFIGYFCGSF